MLALATLIFLASAIGTITGFGTSTIMMPILMLYFPTTEVLVFVSIIHWANAIWRLILFRKGFDAKLILSFGLAGIIAAYFGAKSFFIVDEALMQKVIASFLFTYAVFLFYQPSFKVKFSVTKASLAGAFSGFIAGIFGMGGAIRGAFLAAFNLPKEIYLANSALLLILIDSSRLSTYYLQGVDFLSLLSLKPWQIIFSIFIALAGVQLGKGIVNKIPEEKFRLAIAVFLLLISVVIARSA